MGGGGLDLEDLRVVDNAAWRGVQAGISPWALWGSPMAGSEALAVTLVVALVQTGSSAGWHLKVYHAHCALALSLSPSLSLFLSLSLSLSPSQRFSAYVGLCFPLLFFCYPLFTFTSPL